MEDHALNTLRNVKLEKLESVILNAELVKTTKVSLLIRNHVLTAQLDKLLLFMDNAQLAHQVKKLKMEELAY